MIGRVRVGRVPGMPSFLGRKPGDLQRAISPSGKGGELVYLFNDVSGQSNAAARTTAATTAFDTRLRRFALGLETTDRLDGQSVTNPFPTGWFASLVAYDELSKDRESLHPGMAATTPDANVIIALTPAIGARHWRELGPGTGSWANRYNGFRYAKRYAEAAGATEIRYRTTIDHGEADSDNIAPGGSATDTPAITAEQYKVILEAWATESKRDLRLATVNPDAELPVMGFQPCIVAGDGWRNMQNGHVLAALGTSGYILGGPRYAYAYDSDGVHVQGTGKRLYAEYTGYRWQDVDNGLLLPVLITSASRSGAVCTLEYNTIEGDLVIDTTNVPETTTSYPNSLYGFECFKVSDSSVLAISSISVSGTTLTLTLSTDPGEAVRIRYAQQTWPGGNQSVTGSSSKLNRGNIRDSGARPAVFNSSTHYNWACHQSVEVA